MSTPKLYPHQELAINFVLARFSVNKNAYIATFAGGGKSAIGTHVATLAGKQNIAVIAPKILLHNWDRELDKFGYEGERTIVTYESVKKLPDGPPFDMVIADECQRLKSDSAQRTKAFFSLIKKQKPRVLYLSATPFNRPVDLFPILQREFAQINWPLYVMRYCAGYHDNFGWHAKGASNITELREKLSNFMLVQEEDADFLPPITEEIIVFQQNNTLARLEAKYPSLAELDIEMFLDAPEQHIAFEDISLIRRATADAKIEPVDDYIGELMEPTLIFVYHRDFAEKLAKSMNTRGQKTHVIYGGNTFKKNMLYIEDFYHGKVDFLIMSLTSAIEGLTLTRAKHVVFAEIPWNASTIYQAKKRIHRISQDSPVLITLLTLADSLDKRVTEVVTEKAGALADFGVRI